jgi:hypothetical protein
MSDLFLLVLLAALWLAILVPVVRRSRPDNWLGWLVSSGALAVIATLTYICVAGSRRRRLAAGALLGFLPLASAMVLAAGDWTGLWGFFMISHSSDPSVLVPNLTFATLAGAETTLFVAMVLALGRGAVAATHSRRWRLLCGGVLAITLLAGLVPVGYIYWSLLEPPPDVTRFETAPNHYHRIQEIANQVQTLNPKNVSLAELTIRNTNPAALGELESLYAELVVA